MEEARIVTKVDVQGLSEAVSKFQAFTGSMADTQRAMKQIGVIGQEAVRHSGSVSPQQMEQMVRHIDTLKRSEQEINQLISKRKTDLQGIQDTLMKSLNTGARRIYEQALGQGEDPRAALKSVFGAPSGELADQFRKMDVVQREIVGLEARAGRVQGAMPQAEALANVIAVKTGDSVGHAMERWGHRFGNALVQGMTLVGIGGALAIIAQARSRNIQYRTALAEDRAFLGRHGEGLGDASLAASLPYSLYPNESRTIGRLVGSAGRRIRPGDIGEMSLLGRYFGLGPEGFARDLAGGVGEGKFTGYGQFRQFGITAGGLAEAHGLVPAQRAYFLESNKDLLQQMANWYGGKPLSVESYFSGVHNLLTALRGFGLPMAGAPVALDVTRSLAGGLSPIGKGFEDVIREGAMLGITSEEALSTGKGLRLGYAQKISELMRSNPAGAIRGAARFLGLPTGPGSQLSGSQYDMLVAATQGVGGMTRALDILNTQVMPGGRTALDEVLQSEGRALPKDLEKVMQDVQGEIQKAAQDTWKQGDIKQFIDAQGGMIDWLVKIEGHLNQMLSPIQKAAAAAVIGASGPFIGTLLGSAIGSSVGGVGLKGLLPLLARFGLPAAALATLGYLGYEGGKEIIGDIKKLPEWWNKSPEEKMKEIQAGRTPRTIEEYRSLTEGTKHGGERAGLEAQLRDALQNTRSAYSEVTRLQDALIDNMRATQKNTEALERQGTTNRGRASSAIEKPRR